MLTVLGVPWQAPLLYTAKVTVPVGLGPGTCPVMSATSNTVTGPPLVLTAVLRTLAPLTLSRLMSVVTEELNRETVSGSQAEACEGG